MDPLYLRKLRIDRQIQRQMQNLNNNNKAGSANGANSANTPAVSGEEAGKASEQMNNQAKELVKNIRDEVMTPRRQPKYNYIASMERSDYVKKMMNLPATLPELLIQLQRPNYKNINNVINHQIPQPDVLNDEVVNNDEHRQQNTGNNREQKNENKPNIIQNAGFETVLRDEVKKQDVILNNQQQQQTTNNVKQQLSGNVTTVVQPDVDVEQPQNPVTSNQQVIQKPVGENTKPNLAQPQQPNSPAQPNTPHTPQQPNAPHMPHQPNTPHTPQQPGVPLTPLQPAQPNAPHMPHQPNAPHMPHQPNAPHMPQQPNAPHMPQQPNAPHMPQQPNAPHTPQQPNAPHMPHQPNAPHTPQQPNTPHMPQQPNTPHMPHQPNAPHMPQQPNTPHMPQQPMPLPDNKPVSPNQNVIPPKTQYLDGNVEMYAPHNANNLHRPHEPHNPHNPHNLHGPHNPHRPNIHHPHNQFRPNTPAAPQQPMPTISAQQAAPNILPRPEVRPEQLQHKPHIEHHHSKEVGAVKDTTIDDAQALLYTQLSMNDITNPTLTQMRQRLSDDAFELLFTGMLNLNDLSQTIKHNGKDARSKLILAMANASKQGVDNTQISGSLKMVSESMALEENNPASILKNIILLYLPWYPLQEGVGFNLAIQTMPNMSDFSSLLKVFIQTRNYGNVNGSLILMNANNVDMQIQCDDKFPKDDLLERMKEVTVNHTINSNITVEQRVQMEQEVKNQQAKVNLSSTYDLNPFLLLMAHSFIKNTIIIDGSANV